MRKIDCQAEEKRKLNSVSSDTSSGGVGEGLVERLHIVQRVTEDPLKGTYSLCGLSLLLANTVTKLMGLGGLKKKTPIQFLFVCCCL